MFAINCTNNTNFNFLCKSYKFLFQFVFVILFLFHELITILLIFSLERWPWFSNQAWQFGFIANQIFVRLCLIFPMLRHVFKIMKRKFSPWWSTILLIKDEVLLTIGCTIFPPFYRSRLIIIIILFIQVKGIKSNSNAFRQAYYTDDIWIYVYTHTHTHTYIYIYISQIQSI